MGCAPEEPAAWEFHSFYKPAENPVVGADSAFIFECPVTGEVVRWQQADVFNPGAIVKDDRIYLLLRCFIIYYIYDLGYAGKGKNNTYNQK